MQLFRRTDWLTKDRYGRKLPQPKWHYTTSEGPIGADRGPAVALCGYEVRTVTLSILRRATVKTDKLICQLCKNRLPEKVDTGA